MVLPVHDLNPLRRTPWVTYGLVAANVVVLLLTPTSQTSVTGASAQAQVCHEQSFLDHYAAIPRELTTDHQLTQVATGQPGPSPNTCYVGKPAYHKEPALALRPADHASRCGSLIALLVLVRSHMAAGCAVSVPVLVWW